MKFLELDDMLDVSNSPADIYYNHDTVTMIPVPFVAWGLFYVRLRGYEGRKE